MIVFIPVVFMKKRRFLNPSRLRSRREDAGVAGVQDAGVCSDLTCSAISHFENSDFVPVFSHLFVVTATSCLFFHIFSI